ncbi:MAG: hypothetical protein GY906_24275 [bacterium]|nr:hypothetical protein [bacterium]
MKDLIARLEVATEGSRELDEAIQAELDGYPLPDGHQYGNIPKFTRSLDAPRIAGAGGVAGAGAQADLVQQGRLVGLRIGEKQRDGGEASRPNGGFPANSSPRPLHRSTEGAA